MLRYRAHIAVLLLILVILTACSQITTRVNPTGSITGVVVDSGSGDPIAFALVHVLGTEIWTQSDENGEFILNGVPAGPHRVRSGIIFYHACRPEIGHPAGGRFA